MVPVQQRVAIVQMSILGIIQVNPLRPQPGEEGVSLSFTVTGAVLTFSGPTPALNPTPANPAAVAVPSTITVTNNGTGASGPLNLTAAPVINVTGAVNGTFSATAGSCTGGTAAVPVVVGVGSSCTITFTYTPTTTTTTTGAHVTLTGTGIAAATLNGPNFSAN